MSNDYRKPIIGIVPSSEYNNGAYSYHIRQINIAAIADNGGIPLILPYTKDISVLNYYTNLVSGLYLTGGGDIFPEYFGELAIRELGQLCPPRDAFEILLYQAAARIDLPILGVCRGMQIINVAAGGSLYQDLGVQMKQASNHYPKGIERSQPFHQIQIDKDSQLYQILESDKLSVNSFHHEAIKDPANSYKVTAQASDQVIEAIEAQHLTFSLGVQWHPEDMYHNNQIFAKLYHSLIQAAIAYDRKKG